MKTLDFAERTSRDVPESRHRPVLLHFSADWSGDCRQMAPMIDEVTQVFQDHLDVLTIDVDESRSFSVTMGIGKIPALVLIKDGQLRRSCFGVMSRRQIADFLQSHM